MTPRKLLAWVFTIAITLLVCLGVILIIFDLYVGGFPRLEALTSVSSPLGQAILVAGVAAVPATVLVFLLQATRGDLEFSALGIKIRGPSGPMLLWAVMYLVVAGVILGALAATSNDKDTSIALTRLEAEALIQNNRGNIERCVRDLDETLYLDFVFSVRPYSALNLDIIIGNKVAEFGTHPASLESGVRDGKELVYYLPDPEKYNGKEFTAFVTGEYYAYPEVSIATPSGKLGVIFPDVNRCLIETLKSDLSLFASIKPGPALIHRYITDQGVLASRMYSGFIGESISFAIYDKDFSRARMILSKSISQKYNIDRDEIESLIEKAEVVAKDLKTNIADEEQWERTYEEVSEKIYDLTSNL